MDEYYSYKEVEEKEKKLYLDLKKECKEFNRYVLTEMDAEMLINTWNYSIREYGIINEINRNL